MIFRKRKVYLYVVEYSKGFYLSPFEMEPLLPEDSKGILSALASDLLAKSSRLSGIGNEGARKAIADCLRPMNSYYSNLIEGHDTHPLDIAKALNNEYSTDKQKRDYQQEALAHIELHRKICADLNGSDSKVNPYSEAYIKNIHAAFYHHLPESFRYVKSKEEDVLEVLPGSYRTTEVEVGRHIAPFSERVPLFMERLEQYYDPRSNNNRSKIQRIVAIAAAHHRLAWIHPFLDGNGRVFRLLADACLIIEGLDAGGLWSISRGLARNATSYKAQLANADMHRLNDYDGRGNLSNKMLEEFCIFFLKTAIDQVEFMQEVLDIEYMVERIHRFTDLMVYKKRLRMESKYILTDLFVKGKITKSEAMRITNLSDKTLKNIVEDLQNMRLLHARKEGIQMVYYPGYPVAYTPMLFPGLYPGDKEAEMLFRS
jgi:Fic family protein